MDQLESQLQYFSRTRAIFKPAISQAPSFMPKILWKAHIDFEVEEGERTIARAVYELLIAFRSHLKVWRSYALFEADIPISRAEQKEDKEDEDKEAKMVPGEPALARQVFERGYNDLKSKNLPRSSGF